MATLKHLLENNKAWAQRMRSNDPEFFEKMARGQSPEYLWIGCSDSRVSAQDLVDLSLGELFVHRNIANQVGHTDLNVLSVIQFAVEVLKVRHIIVCGHYGCSGVKAALGDDDNGLIDNWLLNIKDINENYSGELNAITDSDRKDEIMCELNTVAQVRNVCQTTIVRNAWKKGFDLTVHGWIYQLKDGHIKTLGMEISGPEGLDQSCRQAMNASLSA